MKEIIFSLYAIAEVKRFPCRETPVDPLKMKQKVQIFLETLTKCLGFWKEMFWNITLTLMIYGHSYCL